MFDCEEYRTEFGILDLSRNELLSDKLAMQYFEVKKLPKVIDNKERTGTYAVPRGGYQGRGKKYFVPLSIT